MDPRSILIVLLIVGAGTGAFYVLVYPLLSGEAQAEKRQAQLIARGDSKRRAPERNVDAQARRKQVSDSMKEMEQRSAAKKKISMETRIAQAGLHFPKQHFYIASGISAAITTAVLYYMSGSPLISLAGLVIGGLGLPNMWLSHMTKRRLKKFTLAFPNCIDVIIRGVKAGLPLGDCIRIIATDSSEPVRSEFRQIVEAQQLGLTVTEAVEKMPERMPTPEANFFAIVIGIQQKAGGNLGEALSNLSKVLRERKKMRDKVKAMSSEATASASIIGALPLVVGTLVYLTSPHYIELLWLTETGRVVMAVCVFVMAVGVFIMKKMIAFDI
jgi:tight adherence protein B